MSDTRTIYLKNNKGTIYSSDPSNVGYEYLNISDFDSLNPSENSIFTSASNTSLMYSSYDVKLVLTFISDYDNGRQARADWIAKNQNSINQISVANTNNQNLIFSKQAKIKTIDFIENPYLNGVQAELTLELAGRWQSSVNRTSATVYPYTGGTKKYTYHYSTLDRSLLVNRNYVVNSAFSNGFTSWTNENSSWTIDSTTYNGNPVVKSPTTVGSGSRLVQRFINPPDSGSTVTVSFNARGNDSNSVLVVTLFNTNAVNIPLSSSFSRYTVAFTIPNNFGTPQIYFWNNVVGNNVFLNSIKVETGDVASGWTPAPEDTNPKPTYKYGYQIITDEVQTDGYNGFIINIPSQTTPVNVTLTAPSGLSATLTTSQVNVPLQISSDMIGYSLDNFDTFTLLNKGFPASKYWDNLLSVYSTIQTILNANTVTVSVSSSTGSTIPFEFYLYKLQDLI